ncbi:MAG: siderophore-interacting protein [Hamadaea sp.]|nr:siderophore-interacting protein [Hamadaea sp.]
MSWRIFFVEVARVAPLSPSFVRITLTGPDLGDFADNGYDQRFKLILPLPGRGVADLPTTGDWYTDWRALPDERRNPIRTYTVRHVRRALREVDIDVALHGDIGPATRWAAAVRPGDALAVYGPDATFDGDHGGIDFHAPDHMDIVLLAGDETAAPGIAGILERLPADARGTALIEVPATGDALPIAAPAGVTVRWLARDGAPHGSLLVDAVRAAVRQLVPVAVGGSGPAELEDVDIDAELLWEAPVAVPDGCYAWLAGEAAVIKTLRRMLVGEYGMDRRSVAFMGYWRLGRTEDAL